MKVVDANVLIYATDQNARHHAAARDWLGAALSGNEPVGFTWVVLLAYLRIVTNRRIYSQPLSPDMASSIVDDWLARPNAIVIEPAAGHIDHLARLVRSAGTAGNLVNDAHLAAIALQHSAEVVSFDNDFDRFDGIRRVTPPEPSAQV